MEKGCTCMGFERSCAYCRAKDNRTPKGSEATVDEAPEYPISTFGHLKDRIEKPRTGTPAHPTTLEHTTKGLTKREWFAGLAMQGLIQGGGLDAFTSDQIATTAWVMADKTLEAAKEKG